ncbi:MAG: SDR family oxidoreductase [Woeseiaceae bacterium]
MSANEKVRLEIEKSGHESVSVRCDVNVEQDISAAIAATEDAFGGLDILVNNAGIAGLNVPEKMSGEEWSSVIDTNLSSVFRFCRAAHPCSKSSFGTS